MENWHATKILLPTTHDSQGQAHPTKKTI